MSANSNRPIIIKRKKITAGGHHGGAWKVAYADFVTAMMAFFLLMWLINATSEQTRSGIADYFSPELPIARVSGGGSGAFGGDDVFSEGIRHRSGKGGVASEIRGSGGAGLEDALASVDEALTGTSGESTVADDLKKHIVTKVTDEGLVVELFDLPGAPLFETGDDRPTELLRDLSVAVADVFALARNEVAVNGHVASVPVVVRDSPVWALSADRAERAHRLLIGAGLRERRVQRVAGFADRDPSTRDRMDVRNNRIELILLR